MSAGCRHRMENRPCGRRSLAGQAFDREESRYDDDFAFREAGLTGEYNGANTESRANRLQQNRFQEAGLTGEYRSGNPNEGPVDTMDRRRLRQQDDQFYDAQTYGTSERVAGQNFGRGERVASQNYQSNENRFDRDWREDEAQRGRDFASGESALDRNQNARFQEAIIVGCTPKRWENSAVVCSFSKAASATLALNAGL